MIPIYIDHNILLCQHQWQDLAALLRSEIDFRLAVSEWNLVEIADYANKCEALRRASLIDSLNPIWILDRIQIMKKELLNFVYTKFYGEKPCPFTAFSDHLSIIASYHIGPGTPLGLDAKRWVRLFHGACGPINAVKPKHQRALSLLQQASKTEMKRIEREGFRRWILPLIPSRGPSNQWIPVNEKYKILDFCYSLKHELYKECPALAVEDSLFRVRPSDRRRSPKGSDGIDLQHTVLALSYCKFFITRDGFVRECSKFVVGSGRSKCEVVKSAKDVVAKLRLKRAQNSDRLQ